MPIKNRFPWRMSLVRPLSRLALLVLLSGFSRVQAHEGVAVFASGKGNYHTYRIPAIVATNDGTLLAFCEGRRDGAGDAGNIDLLLSRSTDQGATWSEPQLIWDDATNTCGNPAPVVDQQTGVVWLLMTWNLGTDHEREIMAGTSQEPRHVYVCHSADDGVTWTTPERISDSVRRPHWRWYATGPGNGIQLTSGEHAGRLVIPANHSDHSDADHHPYRSHLFWSDDHGATWTLGGVHDDRTNESAVAELSNGDLLQAMRSYHGKGLRAIATSSDSGASWSRVRLAEELTTPVCQASLIAYRWFDSQDNRERQVLLFSSPKGANRSDLTVWGSLDDGVSWPVQLTIDSQEAAYSNLVPLPDGRVGLLYEDDDYRKITWVEFHINELLRQQ